MTSEQIEALRSRAASLVDEAQRFQRLVMRMRPDETAVEWHLSNVLKLAQGCHTSLHPVAVSYAPVRETRGRKGRSDATV